MTQICENLGVLKREKNGDPSGTLGTSKVKKTVILEAQLLRRESSHPSPPLPFQKKTPYRSLFLPGKKKSPVTHKQLFFLARYYKYFHWKIAKGTVEVRMGWGFRYEIGLRFLNFNTHCINSQWSRPLPLKKLFSIV